LRKYRELIDDNTVQALPDRFANSSLFMDCARHGEHQDLFYSGYTKNYNVNRLVITSPDGLFLCSPDPVAGRHTDQYLVNVDGIQSKLAAANVKVLTDKGFTSSSHLAAMPKISEVHSLFAFR
jgi:hypothetical protein